MYFSEINFEACKKAVNFIPNLNDTKAIFNIEHCSFALKSLNCWTFHTLRAVWLKKCYYFCCCKCFILKASCSYKDKSVFRFLQELLSAVDCLQHILCKSNFAILWKKHKTVKVPPSKIPDIKVDLVPLMNFILYLVVTSVSSFVSILAYWPIVLLSYDYYNLICYVYHMNLFRYWFSQFARPVSSTPFLLK